ncbi:MAG: hypothetical protein LC099_10410 [Anaerolineales bacterium]|nr:hypothetical protein [Anaerolineales bacterium]
MKIKSLFRILLFAALATIPFVGVRAQDDTQNNSIILFGENYTLNAGKTLDGSAIIFGGNFTAEEGSRISGSVMVFGGNLSLAKDAVLDGSVAIFGGSGAVAGTVNGSVAVFGGQISLKDGSTVNDVSSFGGQIEREDGAIVKGQIASGKPPRNNPTVEVDPDFPVRRNAERPLWTAARRFGWSVLIAVIGMLLSLFLQPQIDRVASTITSKPLLAGGYGLILAVATPIALIVMAITIILIPVVAVVLLLLPLLWLFGAIALGQEVGARLAKSLNQVWSPVLVSGVGIFLLMIVVEFSKFIPCVGWIPSALTLLVGTGACVLTLFEARTQAAPTEVLPPA